MFDFKGGPFTPEMVQEAFTKLGEALSPDPNGCRTLDFSVELGVSCGVELPVGVNLVYAKSWHVPKTGICSLSDPDLTPV